MMIRIRVDLNNYVEEQTKDLTSDGCHYKMSTKLFWLFNDIKGWKDSRVRCRECGKELHGKNVGSIKAMDFPTFCCRSCQVKNSTTQDTRKITSLELYGVDHPFKSEEVKAKAKATNKRDYGAEWFIGSKVGRERSQKTKLGRYGNPNYVNPEKRDQTNLKRTGYANPFSNPRVIKKMVAKKKAKGDYCNHKQTVATRKQNNNGPYQSPKQLEKSRNTSLKNFGTPNPMQSDVVKEKIKRNNLESFGYEWPG